MTIVDALLPPVKIARQLEAALDAIREAVESDPKLAFFALANAVHDAIDSLDRFDLPPIAGGAPDAYPPTPLDVLALDSPKFIPSLQDWADYAAADYGVCEADLIAAGLPVG